MTDLSGAVAASCCSLVGLRMTRRDPDQRGTQPGRLTPKKWAGTFGRARSPGMDESRRRRNREGRGEPPRLNRWRRRLAESMPSPGAAQAGPGCHAATVADGRRETETDAPRWRKITTWMQGGPKDGIRKPATGEWRAGGRTRDARLESSVSALHSFIKYLSNTPYSTITQ